MNITTKDTTATAQELADRIAGADTNRQAALTLAIAHIDAVVEALRLERIRVAYRFGEDHARVAQIDARMQLASDDRQLVTVEAQRSSITAPGANSSVATLYGRVIDSSQLGVQGLTVRARSADTGAEIGKTGTNEVGHFELTLRPARSAVATIAVMVEVLSSNCKVAYRDSTARPLKVGEVTYAEIEMMSADKGSERPPSSGGGKPPAPTRGKSGPPLPSTRKPSRKHS
jgi:hypothetical protein